MVITDKLLVSNHPLLSNNTTKKNIERSKITCITCTDELNKLPFTILKCCRNHIIWYQCFGFNCAERGCRSEWFINCLGLENYLKSETKWAVNFSGIISIWSHIRRISRWNICLWHNCNWYVWPKKRKASFKVMIRSYHISKKYPFLIGIFF